MINEFLTSKAKPSANDEYIDNTLLRSKAVKTVCAENRLFASKICQVENIIGIDGFETAFGIVYGDGHR